MSVIEVLNSEWAIKPASLEMIQSIYLQRRSHKATAGELADLEAALGRPLNNNADRPYEVRDGVAIIPMFGTMVKRGGMFSDVSGMTSYERVQRDLKMAETDPEVIAAVLNVDSPGGVVNGLATNAAAVSAFAAKKPMCSWTDGMMASAAMWSGAAAGAVYIGNDTTELGSVGVINRHVDVSKMEEMDGVKTTILTAGKYKGVGHPYAPLTAEHQGIMQSRLDYSYTAFVNAMAGYRRASVEQVLADMAEGRVFSGRQAIDAGLADGMLSFDEVLALMRDKGTKATSGALMIFGGFQSGGVRQQESGASSPDQISAGGIASEITQEGAATMTRAELKEKYPALYAEVFGEGQQAAAETERARIVGILEMPGPGAKAHQDLLLAGIRTGLSAGDVALSIQRKEGDLLAEAGKGLQQGAAQAAPVVDADANAQQGKEAAGVEAIVAAADAYNARR